MENQLADSDHTHLGQLLTYAGGTDASTIVWIATRIREEHRQALTWLNEQTGDGVRFFGIEIEVVRIGDSDPAPLFNIVAQPNDWQKQVKAAANATKASGKAPFYQTFWAKFLERLQAEHPDWTRARVPSTANWMNIRSPVRGTVWVPTFASKGILRSELYIDTESQDENEHIFDAFASRKESFENSYGRSLQWDRLDGKRACKIVDTVAGDVTNVENHGAYINWLVDCGVRLRNALATVKIERREATANDERVD